MKLKFLKLLILSSKVVWSPKITLSSQPASKNKGSKPKSKSNSPSLNLNKLQDPYPKKVQVQTKKNKKESRWASEKALKEGFLNSLMAANQSFGMTFKPRRLKKIINQIQSQAYRIVMKALMGKWMKQRNDCCLKHVLICKSKLEIWKSQLWNCSSKSLIVWSLRWRRINQNKLVRRRKKMRFRTCLTTSSKTLSLILRIQRLWSRFNPIDHQKPTEQYRLKVSAKAILLITVRKIGVKASRNLPNQ